eukprot:m.139075 g.139075  ORF g.139075 m.139075 type:complete len:65 (-) comp14790_c1_seq2:56-250(-)
MPTLALSGNYIDSSNVDCASDWLKITSIRSESTRYLLEKLSSSNFEMDLNADSWLSWKEFKKKQ